MPIEANTGEWVPPAKLPWRTRALLAESEEARLRAENEQLKAPITNEWGQTLTPYNHLVVQLAIARAENERLRALIKDYHYAVTPGERIDAIAALAHEAEDH